MFCKQVASANLNTKLVTAFEFQLQRSIHKSKEILVNKEITELLKKTNRIKSVRSEETENKKKI